jgi:hypothetical protein
MKGYFESNLISARKEINSLINTCTECKKCKVDAIVAFDMKLPGPVITNINKYFRCSFCITLSDIINNEPQRDISYFNAVRRSGIMFKYFRALYGINNWVRVMSYLYSMGYYRDKLNGFGCMHPSTMLYHFIISDKFISQSMILYNNTENYSELINEYIDDDDAVTNTDDEGIDDYNSDAYSDSMYGGQGGDDDSDDEDIV